VTQQQNITYKAGDDSDAPTWQRFARQVKAAIEANPKDEQALANRLRIAAHQLHAHLVTALNLPVRSNDLKSQVRPEKPNVSELFYADEEIHAGVQAVAKGSPIPLHDHPGSAGIVLVLSGVVNFQYANVVRNQGSFGLVELEIERVRNRLPGQVCWFHADARNIHRVESMTESAVMLVIHIKQNESGQKHLYFPISDYLPVEGSRVLVHSMSVKRGHSKTNHLN